MVIATKSILSPETDKPGIPLKRSTLIVLGVLFVVLMVIVSLLMSGGGSSAKDSAIPQPEANPPVAAGTEYAIDEEIKQSERERENERAKQATQQAKAQASAPLPADVQRPNSEAALGENIRYPKVHAGPVAGAGAQATGGQGVNANLPGAGTGAAPGSASVPQLRAGRSLEEEAQSRISKVMIADESGPTDKRSVGAAGVQVASNGNDALSAILNGVGQVTGSTAAANNSNARFQQVLDRIGAATANGKVGESAAASENRWLREYAAENQQNASGRKVVTEEPVPGKYVLMQGQVIPAVLGREINSDLPGVITATTLIDVYDSLGGGHLLIPKGSRLVGRYDSGVKVGQARILVAFERLVMPNGVSMTLPAANGSDQGGAAGLSGDVDNHFFKMFASSFVIAVLADQTKQPVSVTTIGGSSGVTTAAGQVLVDVGRTILDRNKAIQPTITIAKGERFNVEVRSDMVFRGPYKN